jgi:hypothetical protein
MTDDKLLALLVWCVWCWACLFFTRSATQQLTLKEDLNALYRRRAARVAKALAAESSGDPVVTPVGYAFSGWVELLKGGKLKIGAEEIPIVGEAFCVEGRDRHRISRARVRSEGRGTCVITSHGLFYRASWTGTEWVVEDITQETATRLGA